MSLLLRRKFSNYLKFSKEVKNAMLHGKGIVALESTVITHGLPYPNNIRTAMDMEEEVRQTGSFPATIAILDGKIHVGLEHQDLEKVAECSEAVKVSSRDIAKTLIKRQVGGTTVAATMKIAHSAGIQVFATGGIGGVHRGADQTFDVSADLQELSHTPVCVVCSGVKSILDIPKTIEYLETHSVNCVVYNEENVFPNFFTPRSECTGQHNTENMDEIIALIETSRKLGLPFGTVLACPIPEEFAADGSVIQEAIDKALEEVKEKGISSNNVTPYILARVNELTDGASMKTNIALLKNNASIAGQLAFKLSLQQNKPTVASRTSSTITSPASVHDPSKPTIVSIGATIVDFEAITTDNIKEDGGSYRGDVVQRMGGVARNHADAFARLNCNSVLLSAVGDDTNADFFIQECSHIDTSRVEIIKDLSTCTYLSMNLHGNVKYGITNCDKLLDFVDEQLIEKNENIIRTCDFIVMDCNFPPNVIDKGLELANKHGKQVWIDPTDIKKVERIFATKNIDAITAASPNLNEFIQWAQLCGVDVKAKQLNSTEMTLDFIEKHKSKIMKNVQFLVVSLAQNGTAIAVQKENGFYGCSLTAPVDPRRVISVSGAGDCFNSGLIAGLVHNLPLDECLELGQRCASLTLQSKLAVSDDIDWVF